MAEEQLITITLNNGPFDGRSVKVSTPLPAALAYSIVDDETLHVYQRTLTDLSSRPPTYNYGYVPPDADPALESAAAPEMFMPSAIIRPTQRLWIDLDGELIQCVVNGFQSAHSGPNEGAIEGLTLRRERSA